MFEPGQCTDLAKESVRINLNAYWTSFSKERYKKFLIKVNVIQVLQSQALTYQCNQHDDLQKCRELFMTDSVCSFSLIMSLVEKI